MTTGGRENNDKYRYRTRRRLLADLSTSRRGTPRSVQSGGTRTELTAAFKMSTTARPSWAGFFIGVSAMLIAQRPNVVIQFLLSLVVLLVVTAAGFAQPRPASEFDPTKLPPDLALIPADAIQFIAFTLGDAWSGAEAESFKQVSSLHPVVPSWALKELPTKVGIEADNVERFTMVTLPTEAVILIRTLRPYDREKVVAALVPEAVERTAGDKSYLHSENSKNSLHVLDDRTLLLGLGIDIKSFLTRPVPQQRDFSIDNAIKALNAGAPIVLHAGPPLVRAVSDQMKLADGEYAALSKAHAWQLLTQANDDGLTIRLLADFRNEEDAAQCTGALNQIGAKLIGYLAFSKESMTKFFKEQNKDYFGASELAPKLKTAIDATIEALRKVSVRSVRNRAGAQVVIKTDEPLTTAALLLTLTPRAPVQ
jgi:hypothetical protein